MAVNRGIKRSWRSIPGIISAHTNPNVKYNNQSTATGTSLLVSQAHDINYDLVTNLTGVGADDMKYASTLLFNIKNTQSFQHQNNYEAIAPLHALNSFLYQLGNNDDEDNVVNRAFGNMLTRYIAPRATHHNGAIHEWVHMDDMINYVGLGLLDGDEGYKKRRVARIRRPRKITEASFGLNYAADEFMVGSGVNRLLIGSKVYAVLAVYMVDEKRFIGPKEPTEEIKSDVKEQVEETAEAEVPKPKKKRRGRRTRRNQDENEEEDFKIESSDMVDTTEVDASTDAKHKEDVQQVATDVKDGVADIPSALRSFLKTDGNGHILCVLPVAVAPGSSLHKTLASIERNNDKLRFLCSKHKARFIGTVGNRIGLSGCWFVGTIQHRRSRNIAPDDRNQEVLSNLQIGNYPASNYKKVEHDQVGLCIGHVL